MFQIRRYQTFSIERCLKFWKPDDNLKHLNKNSLPNWNHNKFKQNHFWIENNKFRIFWIQHYGNSSSAWLEFFESLLCVTPLLFFHFSLLNCSIGDVYESPFSSIIFSFSLPRRKIHLKGWLNSNGVVVCMLLVLFSSLSVRTYL